MLKRILASVAAVSVMAFSSAAWSQGKDIRWATGPIGSSGHKALVVLADLLNKEMPEYRIAVLPTPGAVTTVKGFATGEYDGTYASELAFHELATDSGRMKGFKAEMKHQPVQSFWSYTLETGLAIHARDKDKIKKWADLSGKRVYTGPLPFDTRLHIERALAALGVKHTYVQVDLSTVGSQLQSGSIQGTIIYTSAEVSPVPWLTEAGLAADWAVLNPSPDEIATLKSKNFSILEIKPETFKRDVHVDKVVLSPFYWSFNVGLGMPEADVYKMLTIIEKNKDALAKADQSFLQVAKNMPDMQRRGVTSSADYVPIHPGLAKYMREKGVWDAKWNTKVAAAK